MYSYLFILVYCCATLGAPRLFGFSGNPSISFCGNQSGSDDLGIVYAKEQEHQPNEYNYSRTMNIHRVPFQFSFLLGHHDFIRSLSGKPDLGVAWPGQLD